MTDQALRNYQARAPEREKIPRLLLRLVFAMVIFSLALVTLARLTGMEPGGRAPESPIVQERLIQIISTPDGAAMVVDDTGALVAHYATEEAGFVNGVQRSLDRERMKHGIAGNPPFRLVRHADGRTVLLDPATGWRAEMISFGADNRRAFERMLD